MNILAPPNAIFFLGLVVQFGIRHHFIQEAKAETKTLRQVDRTEKLLLALVLPTALLLPPLYCFTPLLSFADYHLPSSVRWAGVLIMLVSLWLFWRSHVDLGKNWSVSLELRENHELVSHGVYCRIRHPIYTSIWLWGFAQGTILENWLAGWAVVPAFAAMYFIRTPREEKMMREQFGDQYQSYTSRTGRLFPRFSKSPDSRDD